MIRISLLASFIFVSPAFADPQEDADFIVSRTITRTMFEGTLEVQRHLILSALQNDLSEKGIVLSSPERFLDIFMEEFIEEFTLSMQAQTGDIFLNRFSPSELNAIADFYRTPAGQALINASPDLMKAGAKLGQKAGLLQQLLNALR